MYTVNIVIVPTAAQFGVIGLKCTKLSFGFILFLLLNISYCYLKEQIKNHKHHFTVSHNYIVTTDASKPPRTSSKSNLLNASMHPPPIIENIPNAHYLTRIHWLERAYLPQSKQHCTRFTNNLINFSIFVKIKGNFLILQLCGPYNLLTVIKCSLASNL